MASVAASNWVLYMNKMLWCEECGVPKERVRFEVYGLRYDICQECTTRLYGGEGDDGDASGGASSTTSSGQTTGGVAAGNGSATDRDTTGNGTTGHDTTTDQSTTGWVELPVEARPAPMHPVVAARHLPRVRKSVQKKPSARK